MAVVISCANDVMKRDGTCLTPATWMPPQDSTEASATGDQMVETKMREWFQHEGTKHTKIKTQRVEG